MRAMRFTIVGFLFLEVVSTAAFAAEKKAGPKAPKVGMVFTLGGRRATVVKADYLPYVVNSFSQRCIWDTFENPKLKQLRAEYKLDEVIAPGKDEFEKQVLLMDWVRNRIEFGDPQDKGGLRNAQEILRLSRKEQFFFCTQCSAILASASASLGWVCRPLGHSSHSWNEMWSNQHGKWMHFDPTSKLYVEKDGVPLSTYEVKKAFNEGSGKDVTFVYGKERRKKKKKSFRCPHIGYIANTNWLDSGPDWGKRFKTTDKTSARDAQIPYFPVNQATPELTPGGGGLKVTLKTLTPNFKTFQARFDGKKWADVGKTFVWRLHAGRNLLEAKSVNKFGVDGSVSTLEVEVE